MSINVAILPPSICDDGTWQYGLSKIYDSGSILFHDLGLDFSACASIIL